MVRTVWIQITYDYVNTTSTKGIDNLYFYPSAGVKQELKGKTGYIFVPQILHVPSVLQNRYDGVINPIYCEWYRKLQYCCGSILGFVLHWPQNRWSLGSLWYMYNVTVFSKQITQQRLNGSSPPIVSAKSLNNQSFEIDVSYTKIEWL